MATGFDSLPTDLHPFLVTHDSYAPLRVTSRYWRDLCDKLIRVPLAKRPRIAPDVEWFTLGGRHKYSCTPNRTWFMQHGGRICHLRSGNGRYEFLYRDCIGPLPECLSPTFASQFYATSDYKMVAGRSEPQGGIAALGETGYEYRRGRHYCDTILYMESIMLLWNYTPIEFIVSGYNFGPHLISVGVQGHDEVIYQTPELIYESRVGHAEVRTAIDGRVVWRKTSAVMVRADLPAFMQPAARDATHLYLFVTQRCCHEACVETVRTGNEPLTSYRGCHARFKNGAPAPGPARKSCALYDAVTGEQLASRGTIVPWWHHFPAIERSPVGVSKRRPLHWELLTGTESPFL